MARGPLTPLKAEYICADHTVILSFRLRQRGGPYIPIRRDNASAFFKRQRTDPHVAIDRFTVFWLGAGKSKVYVPHCRQ